MSLLKTFSQRIRALQSLVARTRSESSPPPQDASLLKRLVDVIPRTWDLGLTAFGGPPVHFQIFHQRFVEGKGGPPWVDEQTVS
jgi:hypothetical protein